VFNLTNIKTMCVHFNKKKTNDLVKSNIGYTHGRCNVHAELFSLDKVINGIKVSHANLTHCDYNVILDDLKILKLKKTI
jgi:hypothetical protein